MPGRGNLDGHFGIAMHDLKQPEVRVCEFVDSKEYSRLKSMINVYKAFDIVIPAGNEEKGQSKLLGEALTSAFPTSLLQTLNAKFFKSDKGERTMRSLMNFEVSRVSDKIFEKKLTMAALEVLIKYITETRFVYFRRNSLRIHEILLNNTCMIDYASWESLEIVCDEIEQKKRGIKQRRCLVDILDHTITQNGARYLRANVLQPSSDLATIESRQDSVAELVEMEELREKLRQLLARTHELDQVLAMCIQTSASWTVRGAESNINQIVKLVQTLKVIDVIRDALETADVKSTLLKAKIEFLKDERFEEMMRIIEDKICDQPIDSKKNSLALRNSKCFAIREGISVNLDVARKAYLELLEKVEAISEEEIFEKFEENSVRLSYSLTRGFHYTLVTKNAQNVIIPKMFLDVTRNRSTVTFSSRKIISANDRISQVAAEIFLASDIVVSDLIEIIQHTLPVLYYAMDALSTIDFLCSLASYSVSRDTVRPQFGESFSVSNGRHPVLDWADPLSTVPNDTCLTRYRRFGIITGPNMAGKSTYLKQIAQLAIMAQTGAFIPADFAVLPVFTRIFSRMGHNDELMRNKSAFASEMCDASTILKFADRHSLVVMDELARSTSTEEGIAISYAICEKILAIGCYTLLATHFLDISTLAGHSSAIENYHFQPPCDDDETDEGNSKFKHKLMRGPYRGPLYGFEVVELSTFPGSVIEHAVQLAKKLRAQATQENHDLEAQRRRLKIDTWQRMTILAENARREFGANWATNEIVARNFEIIRKSLKDGLKRIEDDDGFIA
ncbi:unnamed protein product [Caenorhabditis bovis]|uniref:DNA mismatch repair proteins mutS family domain-containing protein n=1 Tax=Caenorhabditis bovis TaxID=2654633 RepID=A0A8S1EV67_9PELO|nr:unnamed protein product [Caenorhabditis bovis]